jgi:uncharacterized MAPEG superfamily protein
MGSASAMTIAIICVLIAMLLPFGTVIIAKWKRGFDNNHPREWLAAQTDGRRKRAHAAHLNHFESFPPFAAAVLFAMIRGVDADLVNGLAIAFIVCRLVFTWAYIQDKATFRSLVWVVGIGCVVALFIAAAMR